MRKKTTGRVGMVIVFCGMSLPLWGGCYKHLLSKGERETDTPTKSEEKILFADIGSKHPIEYLGIPPHRGILPCNRDGVPSWIVWTTETSPVGKGVIGIYNRDHELVDWCITETILDLKHNTLDDRKEILTVREVWSSGTGIYKERMIIFSTDNLHHLLWSEIIESWEYGVEGRNEGHLERKFVALHDLDADGTKELLVVAYKHRGMELSGRKLAIHSTVFTFEPSENRFKLRNDNILEILNDPAIIY